MLRSDGQRLGCSMHQCLPRNLREGTKGRKEEEGKRGLQNRPLLSGGGGWGWPPALVRGSQ